MRLRGDQQVQDLAIGSAPLRSTSNSHDAGGMVQEHGTPSALEREIASLSGMVLPTHAEARSRCMQGSCGPETVLSPSGHDDGNTANCTQQSANVSGKIVVSLADAISPSSSLLMRQHIVCPVRCHSGGALGEASAAAAMPVAGQSSADVARASVCEGGSLRANAAVATGVADDGRTHVDGAEQGSVRGGKKRAVREWSPPQQVAWSQSIHEHCVGGVGERVYGRSTVVHSGGAECSVVSKIERSRSALATRERAVPDCYLSFVNNSAACDDAATQREGKKEGEESSSSCSKGPAAAGLLTSATVDTRQCKISAGHHSHDRVRGVPRSETASHDRACTHTRTCMKSRAEMVSSVRAINHAGEACVVDEAFIDACMEIQHHGAHGPWQDGPGETERRRGRGVHGETGVGFGASAGIPPKMKVSESDSVVEHAQPPLVVVEHEHGATQTTTTVNTAIAWAADAVPGRKIAEVFFEKLRFHELMPPLEIVKGAFTAVVEVSAEKTPEEIFGVLSTYLERHIRRIDGDGGGSSHGEQ